jgi:hypothetical protein
MLPRPATGLADRAEDIAHFIRPETLLAGQPTSSPAVWDCRIDDSDKQRERFAPVFLPGTNLCTVWRVLRSFVKVINSLFCRRREQTRPGRPISSGLGLCRASRASTASTNTRTRCHRTPCHPEAAGSIYLACDFLPCTDPARCATSYGWPATRHCRANLPRRRPDEDLRYQRLPGHAGASGSPHGDQRPGFGPGPAADSGGTRGGPEGSHAAGPAGPGGVCA